MSTFPTSDLSIPLVAAILDLVKERRDLAQHHEDAAGVRQLDRVRMSLLNGARLAWSYGDLLIQSVNTPGAVYSVNRAGCSCPNGVAGRASCWHVALYDLLLDMAETAADSADIDAERDAGDGGGDDDPPTPITITSTPDGLALSRGGITIVTDAGALVKAIERLLNPPPVDGRAMGQRLAAARQRYAA